MSWIRNTEDRTGIPAAHRCNMPRRAEPGAIVADAHPHDMWGCDLCGRVWVATSMADGTVRWIRGSWLVQRRHGQRYTCGCRVGSPIRRCRRRPGVPSTHGRLETGAHLIPPAGGGGVAVSDELPVTPGREGDW